jgi:hypothetical protein
MGGQMEDVVCPGQQSIQIGLDQIRSDKSEPRVRQELKEAVFFDGEWVGV